MTKREKTKVKGEKMKLDTKKFTQKLSPLVFGRREERSDGESLKYSRKRIMKVFGAF